MSTSSEVKPAAAAELLERLNAWADGGPDWRARDRFPIACTLLLTPLSDTSELMHNKSVQVIGKDLSTQGIAFSHMDPLQCKCAVLAYSHPQAGRFEVELEVIWSKPTPIGHFESGCQLIRKLSPGEFQLNS